MCWTPRNVLDCGALVSRRELQCGVMLCGVAVPSDEVIRPVVPASVVMERTEVQCAADEMVCRREM